MTDTDLLDVSVLVSLAWPNHVHHLAAQRWFRSRGEGPWATTPSSECGFVRVSSNRAAVGAAVRPEEAISLLARLRTVKGHAFLPDDIEVVIEDGARKDLVERGTVLSYKLVTDAHLLAVARRHGARLATLDRAVLALAGKQPADVLVIPT